jgi:hypothetical protein
LPTDPSLVVRRRIDIDERAFVFNINVELLSAVSPDDFLGASLWIRPAEFIEERAIENDRMTVLAVSLRAYDQGTPPTILIK